MDTNGELLESAPWLEIEFPDLADWGYVITSDPTHEYNCIAWAAGDNERIWWPYEPYDLGDAYWPDGAPLEETIEAFCVAYGTLGYAICDTEDYEDGFEKIAIFANENGDVKHAARQLGDKRWTSKMGVHVDMSHPLRAVEGKRYGRAVVFMRRLTTRPESAAGDKSKELGAPLLVDAND